MPTRFAMVFCATLLVGACAAPAGRTVAGPEAAADGTAAGTALAAAEADATAEEDPIVCKTIERTGTRVSERICMRRSAMEKQQRNAEEMLGEVQRRGAMQSDTLP